MLCPASGMREWVVRHTHTQAHTKAGRHSSELYIKSKKRKRNVYKKKMQVQGKHTSYEQRIKQFENEHTHTDTRTPAHTHTNTLAQLEGATSFDWSSWVPYSKPLRMKRGTTTTSAWLPLSSCSCICVCVCICARVRPLLFYTQIGLMLFYAGFLFI